MTPTEQQITDLLRHKQNIDKMVEGEFSENFRLLLHAVKFLLRLELSRTCSVSPPDQPWWDITRPPDVP